MDVKQIKRSAGILLHITSLPSAFGIGDLGPEAFAFINFLKKSKQTFWQLLPLNPVSKDQAYSPYSSHSAMAGNTLLISPEQLVKEKLLTKADIKNATLPAKKQVAFSEAERVKCALFDKAYANFKKQNDKEAGKQFTSFCNNEAYWLDDFALYVCLKAFHQQQPWFKWSKEYKTRDANVVKTFVETYADDIEKVKWLQWIFLKQYIQLKQYANERGIQLFGDMPFYVGYDSAEVWSHPEIFSIDKNGKAIYVAGVPPDLFNENGQLWGMPVFRWDVLQEQNFDWWVKRMKKNIQLFDLLRLDHFRAFASYWQVKATEQTAKKGKWIQGPGVEIFEVFKNRFGQLPFVAEDLGDINDAVYELRDAYELPGMNVLQFAFGDNMAQSPYIPHHHIRQSIVYTGTHDNNTTIGWFKTLPAGDLQRIEQYCGEKVNAKSIWKLFNRLAYASVSNIAILPVQDVLGLDEKARMNLPAAIEKNWLWRLLPNQLNEEVSIYLKELCKVYDRTNNL